MAAAALRSVARRIAGSPLFHAAPPSGALILRAAPSSPLPQPKPEVVSKLKVVSKRKLVQDCVFLQESEIKMLQDLAYKLPPPPDVPSLPRAPKPASSKDDWKDLFFFAFGLTAMNEAFRWYYH